MIGTEVRVVTAPDPWVNAGPGAVAVFLAGGIQNCSLWQWDAIALLREIPHLGEVVVYNPRREDFPMGDPNAARQQIGWEFQMLERAHVFSMWFAASKVSDDPICMYEMGRHLALRLRDRQAHLVALGVEPGYRRERDVAIQVELACAEHPTEYVEVARSLPEHVRDIGLAVLAARAFGEALRDKGRGVEA